MPPPLRLESLAALESALATSASRPVMLLKHSTRCPVSFRAHDEFLRFAADQPAGDSGVLAAVVLVVEDRAVSNEVTARLGVAHESPQAILVVNGVAVWHESQEGVDARRLGQAVDLAG
jgi:bacillithiol system protein YtxJ